MTKKISFLFITLIFFSVSLNAQVNNKIIIKVENEIITNYDLKNKILSFLILRGEPINQDNINKFKPQALEVLIQQKLKKIELANYNMKRDEKKINQYLLNISSNNIERFKEIFLQNNLDYDLFLEEIEVQIMWQELIYKIYSNKIKIDENVIEQELKDYLKKSKEIVEFKISEIEIFNENKNLEQDNIVLIQNKIQEIGFENTALNYSTSSSARNKGDLGWLEAKSLSKSINDILTKMSIGEISKPIKRQDSIIFLKLVDKRKIQSEKIDLDKYKLRVIAQKRNEMFDLYSKSHLSKLKNNNLVEYQ